MYKMNENICFIFKPKIQHNFSQTTLKADITKHSSQVPRNYTFPKKVKNLAHTKKAFALRCTIKKLQQIGGGNHDTSKFPKESVCLYKQLKTKQNIRN